MRCPLAGRRIVDLHKPIGCEHRFILHGSRAFKFCGLWKRRRGPCVRAAVIDIRHIAENRVPVVAARIATREDRKRADSECGGVIAGLREPGSRPLARAVIVDLDGVGRFDRTHLENCLAGHGGLYVRIEILEWQWECGEFASARVVDVIERDAIAAGGIAIPLEEKNIIAQDGRRAKEA